MADVEYFAAKLSLSRDDSETLVNQLVHQLADMIDAGELPVGSRMPSSVKLSKALKVAYCTVETAFRHLSEQGYIDRSRRGSFVKYPLMKPQVTMAKKMARKVLMLFCDKAEQESVFKQKVVSGIRDVLKEPGFNIETMLVSDFLDEGLSWSHELVNSKGFDALIIDKEGIADTECMNFAQNTKTPFLLFGAILWACYHNSLTILPDYGYGIHQAVDHLVSLGHRRIVFMVHDSDHRPNFIKEQSFRDAVDGHGLKFDESLMISRVGFDDAGVEKAMENLLANDSRPTSLVCADDIIAYEAMMFLKSKGISVPQDISIVGYNDFDVCSIVKPHISSVHVPLRQMGQTIAEKLLERMAGKITSGMMHIPVNLIVRDTTCINSADVSA